MRVYVTFWVTRDAYPDDGSPSPFVDVWYSKPVRVTIDNGALWVDRDGLLGERFGRWPIAFAREIGSLPDDSRQCIRVGPESDTREALACL